MEVLISVFILSIGLLGVAALIPIGKLAMIETAKSDRTGACGRAALRDVKVRRMLDYTAWWSSSGAIAGTATPGTIVIDPLGLTATPPLPSTLAGVTGGVPRITLASGGVPINLAAADLLFRWRDDLIFVLPKDMKPPGIGDRPLGLFVQADGSISHLVVSSLPASEGNLSWFLMVSPAPSEAALPVAQRRLYSVAVVVCYKRVLSTETSLSAACDSAIGYGGVGITLSGNQPAKQNEWILLRSNVNDQTTWYRVVGAGYDGTNTRATLVGPDWYGGNSAAAIIVGGVSGVYTTTVQLDTDLIWNR